jgi:hypothetical protein
MAAPVFDSAGAGAFANSTSINLPYPATVAANDLLFLHHVVRESGHAVTTPAGWDVIQATIDNTFTIFTTLYAKVAAGTETGNLTVNIGGGAAATLGRIYRFTGNAISAYSEGLSNSGIGDISATVTDAGVTTTGVDRLALNFVACSGTGSIGSFTGETGGDWTEAVAEFTDATNGQIQLQTATMAAAGTIDGGTLTQGGSQYLVLGVAILPTAPTNTTQPARHGIGLGRW